MKKTRLGFFLLGLIFVISATVMLLQAPIRQQESYHYFSDTQTLLGLPNFWNVASNLPFLAVGLLGIQKLRSRPLPYLIFFGGVALVAFGSGYYHLWPNNYTLIWDRLPMTVAFMALCAILIREFIGKSIGQMLLFPLLGIGILSVILWSIFDDLRLYAFVQFYPMLGIPVVLLCFKSPIFSTKGYWILLFAYIAAKLLEHYDHQIHETFGVISGHSLKHLAAAAGLFGLLDSYEKNIQHLA